MILMVCGTQKFPLDRMLREMDRLIETGVITEEVFAQTGFSTYEPKHFAWSQFLNGDEFEEKIHQCRVLLTHGGVGTILTAKELGKPVLVFPRSARYGEHVDDHQWQIARAFRDRGYVLVCEEADRMAQMLERCDSYPFKSLQPGENVQTAVIRSFLKPKTPVGR